MKLENAYLPLVILLFCANHSLNSQTISGKAYDIVLEDEIYVEKFDSSNTNKLKYTANNQCYKTGHQYIYDYYYQDLKGFKYKLQPLDETPGMDFYEKQKAWNFARIDTMNEVTIDLVILTVDTDTNHVFYTIPGYDQSLITYDYLSPTGTNMLFEVTGLIENEKNIWFHPPRSKMFRILEINPFPFIMAPYEIGNTWSWTLNNIASQWGDERWKTWEGVIESTCSYEITNQLWLQTNMGELKCFEIQSSATSTLGKTYLTSYFNMDVGFVKLEYTNIDSTKVVLELIQVIRE